MLKVSDNILRKVYNCLVKMYNGDRLQMRKAIDTIVTEDRSWGSDYQKILSRLAKAIGVQEDDCTRNLAIQACKQIKDPWATDTTEKSPPAKTQSTTEKTYKQLSPTPSLRRITIPSAGLLVRHAPFTFYYFLNSSSSHRHRRRSRV